MNCSSIEIGHYYFNNNVCIPHCNTSLCEIFSGVIKRISIDDESTSLDLKKIIVILSKSSRLVVPSEWMLKIQRVYAELSHSESYERTELMSKIIDLLKSKGVLPENETAVFKSGKRARTLWFISSATIEREETSQPDQNPEQRKLFPILFCETHESELTYGIRPVFVLFQ